MSARPELLPATAFASAFADAPVRIAVLDAELRFVFCNERLAEMNGVPARDHLGRGIADVLPELPAEAAEAFAQVVRTGEPILDWELVGETPAQPGVRRTWIEHVYPVRHDRAVAGVAALVLEVTGRRAAERERDEARALLDALFEHAPLGLGFWDRELRYVRVNAALAEINGVPPEEHAGPRDPRRAARHGARGARGPPRGARVRPPGARGRGLRADARRPGRGAPLAHRLPPGRGAEDAVVGVGGIVDEITEEVALRTEQARLRAELAREQRLLADLIARAPAGIALLWGPEHRFRLLNDAYLRLVPARGELAGRPLLEALPEAQDVAALLDRVRAGEGPITRDDYPVPFHGPGSWRGHRYYRFSLDPVPVPGGGIGGVLAVVVEVSEHVRRRDELEAQLEVERRIATTLQRALLPDALPEIPGATIASRYQAAGAAHQVGGDFFDAFDNADGTWTLVVGDVCGKGPEAAAVTAMVRYTIRAEAGHDPDPRRLIEVLNAEMLRHGASAGAGSELPVLCTVVCATVRAREDGLDVRLAAAGHPAPVHAGDHRAAPVELRGPMVGILAGASYPARTLRLTRGEALVLYTDGVLEAHAPAIQLGAGDVARALAGEAAPTADALADRVLALTALGDAPARDDIAILVLRAGP